jgi:hypothetical protein
MRQVVWLITICASLLINPAGSTGQPGPATELVMTNISPDNVVFVIYRADATFTYNVESGNHYKTQIKDTKDDRVIFACQAGNGTEPYARPFKVYATQHFNAHEWPGPAVAAVLGKDQSGEYKITFLFAHPDGIRPLPNAMPGVAKYIEAHKETITKAMGRPQKEAPTKP